MALKFSILFISILFVGCSDELSKKASEEAQPKKITIQSSALGESVKVAITGADPEKYTVQFSWPNVEKGKILRIRLGSVLQEILSTQTFFTHVVAHNQTLNYSFDILDANRKPEQTFRKTVIVPYDFVVKPGTESLLENRKLEANRIFLSDKLPLTTNGITLDIVTNELHAANGTVETFPEKMKRQNTQGYQEDIPQTASDEKDGRSGGYISISAKKLFGRLHVYMRGEKGGRGGKGSAKLSAAFGYPAEVGSVQCSEPNPCGRSLSCFAVPPTFSAVRDCSCRNDLKSGGPGADGEKGNPGKPGMRGGDSGSVRIMIQEFIPSEGIDPSLPSDGTGVVEVLQIPGAPGDGGPGGDGQPGGRGGLGRDVGKRLDCKGESGQPGRDGPFGEKGPLGETGAVGMKCIYIGSENQNDCSQGDGR